MLFCFPVDFLHFSCCVLPTTSTLLNILLFFFFHGENTDVSLTLSSLPAHSLTGIQQSLVYRVLNPSLVTVIPSLKLLCMPLHCQPKYITI